MGNKIYHSIEELRKEKGLSLAAFASTIDASISTVKKWKSEDKNPETYHLLQICEKFNCDLDYLIGRLPEPTHDIQFIHDQTGLTGKAVKKLQENRGLSFILSLLIEQPDFVALLYTINQLMGIYMLHPQDPEEDDDLYIREEKEFVTYKHLIRILESIPQEDYLERLSNAMENHYPVKDLEEK